MNVGVYDLIDEIGDVIDRAGGTGVRIDNLTREAPQAFRVWVQGKPRDTELDGVDRALAIRRVHRKADSMLGLKRVWQRRLMPCPTCNLPTLGSWFGEGTVTCTNEDCTTSLTRDEYDLMVIAKSRQDRK